LFCCRGNAREKTTSSILGHILYESGADASFIGGIVENYNSNLVGKTVTVVEADEFDRSFAFANIACITSMDADHLDIYGTSDAIKESFVEFANKVKIK
jgi:UDP-N-acetylmuramate--alanine ligase